MTMPRNFADELAALVNPAPQEELDPEVALLTDGDRLGGSDDELAGLVAAAGNQRAIPADIILEGRQYTGRRSSRAALFGDQQQDSAGERDSSDSDEALVPPNATQEQQQRRPFIDYATIPTMFVNGHINHGPGPDDTSSSSTLGDSEEEDQQEEHEEQEEEEQQQQQQHHHQQREQDAVMMSTEAVHLGSVQVVPMQEDQQQQQEQPQQQPADATAQQQPSSSPERQLQDPQEHDVLDREEAVAHQQHNEQHAGQLQQQQHHHHQQDEEQQAAGTDEQHQQPSDHEGETAAASGDGVNDSVGTAAALLGEDAEMQELEREAAAAEAEAAEQLVAAAAHSGKDAAKAAAVRAQQRLWGAALELRIRLQKAVSGANVLPRPTAAAGLKAADKQIAKGYTSLLSACQATLEGMLHLHHTLAQQHPAAAAAALAATEAAASARPSKRSRKVAGLADDQQRPNKCAGCCSTAAAAWQSVDSAIDSLAGFRDASIDKWHRRTVLSSGTAALRGSSGLRALQQSVSRQVSSLMSEQHKLIRRSQLPCQLAPRPLGQLATAAGANADESSGDGVGDRDPETYDEGDFYQQLLKELIEAAPDGSLGAQLIAARPAKRRKIVDRRASKGRKLRFHTLDKLVGFMAPTQLTTPPFADQLFANLFTHNG